MFLYELRTRILQKLEARNVSLKVVKKSHNGLHSGTVVVVENVIAREGKTADGHNVRFNPRFVREKQRSEWTLEDVYRHIISKDTRTQRNSLNGLNMLRNTKRIGQIFQGTFCIAPGTMRLEHLLESIESHFGKREASFQYIWLGIFCIDKPFDLKANNKLQLDEMRNMMLSFDKWLVCFDSLIEPQIDALTSMCLKILIHAEEKFVVSNAEKLKQNFLEEISSGSDFNFSQKLHGVSLLCEETDIILEEESEKLDSSFRQIIEQNLLNLAYSRTEEAIAANDFDHFFKIMRFFEDIGRIGNARAIELVDPAIVRLEEYYGPGGGRDINSNILYGQEYAKFVNDAGSVRLQQGRFRDAKDLYEKGIILLGNLDKLLHGNLQFDYLVARNFLSLSIIHRKLGGLKAAEKNCRKAVKTNMDLDMYSIDTAQALCTYGDIMCDMSEIEKAQEFYKKSLTVLKKLIEIEPDEIKYRLEQNLVLTNFATLYAEMGKFDKAIATTREAIRFEEHYYGMGSLNLSVNYDNLANYLGALFQENREADTYQEAKNYFEMSLSLKARHLPADHVSIAKSKYGLALLLLDNGETVDAMRQGKEALKLFIRHLGEENNRTKRALEIFGNKESNVESSSI